MDKEWFISLYPYSTTFPSHWLDKEAKKCSFNDSQTWIFTTVRQYDIKSVNIQVNRSVTVWIPGSLFHQTGKMPHSTPIALHANCNKAHYCHIPTNCLTIGNLYSFFARQFIPRYIGTWQTKWENTWWTETEKQACPLHKMIPTTVLFLPNL